MTAVSNAPFRGPLARAAHHENAAVGDSWGAALAPLLRAPEAVLPVNPAEDRLWWALESGRVHAFTANAIIDTALADLAQPWPLPVASAAVRVHRDGDRDHWESLAFARQQRLSRAAVAAAVTLDDRWIDEVADGIVLLCEQSSWCWPGHDDSFQSHHSVLATVTDPFVDLGAGEVVAQLAWLDQLLGAQLDARYPGLRARIRHEAKVRVMEPFVRRRDWHWIGLDGDPHNWNPWIHGNVIVAALRLLDAPDEVELRAIVVGLAVEGLDRYVESLPADGAIDEGYSYWWNGACRALEALDILRHATNGLFDTAGSIPSLRETVAFPSRMHLGGDWYYNVADGQARPSRDQPWHVVHRAALHTGDELAAAHASSYRVDGGTVATESAGLGRLLRGITDTAWAAARPASRAMPLDVWLPSTQVLVTRQHPSPRGLTVAVKGGHNGEHHNHNDVGSFVVASDGVPFLVDAGRPTYTADTFGPSRYSIWTMQSAWHSVPEIAGVEQGVGANFAAQGVSVDIGADATEFTAELRGAYPVETLRSWQRTIRLDRTQRGRVVIDDFWDLGGDTTAATVVRLLVAGHVELGTGVAHIAPVQGAPRAVLRWPAQVSASLVVRELDDPMLTEVWGDRLTRIDLDVSERSTLSVTVELDTTTHEDDQ